MPGMQEGPLAAFYSGCTALMGVVLIAGSAGSALRAVRLHMARNGHGGAVTACLLSGAKRKASTRDEYFAF
jgi:hypothetical protein